MNRQDRLATPVDVIDALDTAAKLIDRAISGNVRALAELWDLNESTSVLSQLADALTSIKCARENARALLNDEQLANFECEAAE